MTGLMSTRDAFYRNDSGPPRALSAIAAQDPISTVAPKPDPTPVRTSYMMYELPRAFLQLFRDLKMVPIAFKDAV